MAENTKKECIATLKKYGWQYHGFLDAGWGEKFYTFTSPEKVTVTMKLGELRRKAYDVDMCYWFGQQRAQERVGL